MPGKNDDNDCILAKLSVPEALALMRGRQGSLASFILKHYPKLKPGEAFKIDTERISPGSLQGSLSVLRKKDKDKLLVDARVMIRNQKDPKTIEAYLVRLPDVGGKSK